MSRKKNGRNISGILLIDKPQGETSNRVLQRAKRLFNANKAGHTGSLDPLATGVLPICFGEATKFSQYLLNSDKAYLSTFRFGIVTDSADSDGNIVTEVESTSVTEEQILQAIPHYMGDILQIPPMYSALKKDGQPLYKLARQGIEIDRPARPVTIYTYELLAFRPATDERHAEIDVHILCSKGTYIRSLAHDLGQDLNVGAHLTVLRRIKVGHFDEPQSITLDALEAQRDAVDSGSDSSVSGAPASGLSSSERSPSALSPSAQQTLDAHLLPVDAAIDSMPKVVLDENTRTYFCYGHSVMCTQAYRLGAEGDTVRVFSDSGDFLGIALISDDGHIVPKRLVST